MTGCRRGITLIVALALTVVVGCLAAPRTFADDDQGNLTIVGSALTLMTDHTGTASERGTITVENDSKRAVLPELRLSLTDGNTAVSGATATPAGGGTFPQIKAGATERLTFVARGLPPFASVTGQLIVTSADTVAAPAQVGLSIAPAPSAPSYHVSTVWLIPCSLVVGALIVLLGYELNDGSWKSEPKHRRRLLKSIAADKFDFSGSFASSTTLIGGLLGTIIAASLVPDNTVYLSKDTYVALNVIFGALVPLGAVVFNAAQTDDNTGAPHSPVWGFLLAAAITAGAAIGELATVGFLVLDFGHASGLPAGGSTILVVIVVLGALITAVYIARTVKHVTEPPPPRSSSGPAHARPGPAGGEAEAPVAENVEAPVAEEPPIHRRRPRVLLGVV